jgi:hypothetical protein
MGAPFLGAEFVSDGTGRGAPRVPAGSFGAPMESGYHGFRLKTMRRMHMSLQS